MKTELIHTFTSTFEAHAQQPESGVEYWLARGLQHLLGYAEWRNFRSTAIPKAKVACEVAGHAVSDHSVDVNKMVDLNLKDHRWVRWGRSGRCLSYLQQINSGAIDHGVSRQYRKQHIRPLAVRPLNYPEREPTPWGFLFSAVKKRAAQALPGWLS